MAGEPVETYTADDFLRAASDAGISRSLPWLRSLVRDGLLDQPDKHGLPGQRGGRAPGTWPRTQFKLFSTLLDQMQKGTTQTATLCNVPVFLWLYFGSEYAPVRQVRRALGTYGAQYRVISARRGRYTARQVVELFGGGRDMSRRDRDRLVKEIVAVGRSGALDRESLIDAAGRIFDPEQRGRKVGPDGARLDVEGWVRMIEARLTALDRLYELDDSAFEDARLAHHQHLAEYVELQPGFGRDRETGAMHEPITFERLLNSACIDTLTILGFLELARERGPSITDKSPPRPRQRSGGMTPKEAPFDAGQHATARRQASRRSPQRVSAA